MRLSLLLPALLLLLCSFSSALQLTIRQGESVCLAETISSGDLFIGEYFISPPGARLQITVTSPTGYSLLSRTATGQYGDLSSTSSPVASSAASAESRFAQTATTGGEYQFCFINDLYDAAAPQQKQIVFNLRAGIGTKDYGEIAKKESLKPIEVELKRLEDLTAKVHQQIKALSEREITMRATNDSTGARVVWFSVIGLLTLFSLKAAEIWYLKRYFHAKKLIQ